MSRQSDGTYLRWLGTLLVILVQYTLILSAIKHEGWKVRTEMRRIAAEAQR